MKLRAKAALLLGLMLVGVVGLWPVSAYAGSSEVTTELGNGVVCTTHTIVIGYGVSPGGNRTAHEVVCNRAVERLQVNGGQTLYRPDRYYRRSEVCYNTNRCSTYIEVWRFEYGIWLATTSGHVGTMSDEFHYGIANTAYHTIDCSMFYCIDGPPLD